MRDWFDYSDLHSCAQHYEAKILANKLYNRWITACDKLHECVTQPDFNERKFNGISDNIEKIERELANIIRGTMRCCAPERHGFTNPFKSPPNPYLT